MAELISFEVEISLTTERVNQEAVYQRELQLQCVDDAPNHFMKGETSVNNGRQG